MDGHRLAIGTYLNWKFVAKRLRKYSEKAGNAITVPDFFSNRFHDTKHILMTIAAIIHPAVLQHLHGQLASSPAASCSRRCSAGITR